MAIYDHRAGRDADGANARYLQLRKVSLGRVADTTVLLLNRHSRAINSDLLVLYPDHGITHPPDEHTDTI